MCGKNYIGAHLVTLYLPPLFPSAPIPHLPFHLTYLLHFPQLFLLLLFLLLSSALRSQLGVVWKCVL